MDNQSIIENLIELWEREYPWQSKKKIHFFDWEIKTIEVKNIKTFTPRRKSKAKGYRDLMKIGTEFPPIVVIRQKKDTDKYILIDGFHRTWAYKNLGVETVNAYVGTKKGAGIARNFIDKGLYN